MRFTDNAMSVILLCSHIGIGKEDSEMRPFSQKEWSDFLDLILQHGMEPRVILEEGMGWAKELCLPEKEASRIHRLSLRGGGVALELDLLRGKGIEVTTVLDSSYPVLMKRNLGKKAPPILYYVGDISLAGKVGIGVAGSRNVDEDGVRFARGLAGKAARERLVVYTGGAKGVDTVAETITMESGGAAVAYVADSLSARLHKSAVVQNVIDGKLLLISDVKPDAGFTVARAMNRNKYVYASAYGSFVVASDKDRGGTWAGATEALRAGWSKVLAWDHPSYEGNSALIRLGAIPYVLSDEALYDVVTKKEDSYEQADLFHLASAQ